jgi:hypothetical protein
MNETVALAAAARRRELLRQKAAAAEAEVAVSNLEGCVMGRYSRNSVQNYII